MITGKQLKEIAARIPDDAKVGTFSLGRQIEAEDVVQLCFEMFGQEKWHDNYVIVNGQMTTANLFIDKPQRENHLPEYGRGIPIIYGPAPEGKPIVGAVLDEPALSPEQIKHVDDYFGRSQEDRSVQITHSILTSSMLPESHIQQGEVGSIHDAPTVPWDIPPIAISLNDISNNSFKAKQNIFNKWLADVSQRTGWSLLECFIHWDGINNGLSMRYVIPNAQIPEVGFPRKEMAVERWPALEFEEGCTTGEPKYRFFWPKEFEE